MKKTTLLVALTTLVCNLNAARRACLWAALGLLAALACVSPPAQATATEAWVHRYSNVLSNSNDQAVQVVRNAAGDIVVTGNSEGDMLTIKYSGADGTVIWQQRYNGPANSSAYASAMAVDGSDYVVVTGWSDGSGGSLSDYYTAKYPTADGALLWEKRYHGPANGDDRVGPDYFRAIDPTSGSSQGLAMGPNGMVAITGSSECDFGSGTAYDYATIVYRENLPPVSVTLVPAGIRLRFSGIPGHSYSIERAAAITGPWSTLATPIAPLSGLIEYVNTNWPVAASFYRTAQP